MPYDSDDRSYRNVRLMVLFDMPVDTPAKRKAYAQFRKFIMDDGFMMLQYSVYTRYCNNDSDADKHIKRISTWKAEYGNIRLLKVTENQFTSMILIAGEKTEQELSESYEQLVII